MLPPSQGWGSGCEHGCEHECSPLDSKKRGHLGWKAEQRLEGAWAHEAMRLCTSPRAASVHAPWCVREKCSFTFLTTKWDLCPMQPKPSPMHTGVTGEETGRGLKPRPTNSTKSKVLSIAPGSLNKRCLPILKMSNNILIAYRSPDGPHSF